MKITAVVIAFLFVQSLQIVQDLQAFPGDEPEKFESIILEKPWVIQFSLIDKEGFSMRQSYNYTMNAGKYLSKNVLLRAGFNFGKREENFDKTYSDIGVSPFSNFENSQADGNIYGGTIDGLYNFMPDNKLQLLAGISAGYEYFTMDRNRNTSNSSSSEKTSSDILRAGIAASINFFVHRQIGLYIENKIYYSHSKLTSDHVNFYENGESRSHNKLSSNNITFDNLLLGIGFYF
jgi:hypothetical protein